LRAPFQVLVIPFRHTGRGLEYCLLKRSDVDYWQFVAGGGEEGESALQAAERETSEEIGIVAFGRLLRLDSMSTVPKNCFAAAEEWGDDVYVIPEHSFAINVGNCEPSLSVEHTEYRWARYDDAQALLRWDSNKNGLWELHQRLMRE